jgi:putative FmdB family regulatory protein
MPTYEYRCEKGHTFERFQSMTEEPIDTCPECGAPAERLLSAGAGLLFMGSGFYIRDYRSDSYKKAAAADSESKSEKKSESKPASKADGGTKKSESSGGSSGTSSGASD